MRNIGAAMDPLPTGQPNARSGRWINVNGNLMISEILSISYSNITKKWYASTNRGIG